MRTKQLSIFQLLAIMLASACPVWAHADLQANQTMEMSVAQLKAQPDAEAIDPDQSIESLGPVPNANSANYAFSTTVTGSLVDMSSRTTTLVAADQDDTASAITLIGFDFYFQDTRQDRFSVNSNGSLRFGATAISTTLYDPLGPAGQALVTAYGADQRTHAGNGKVHFKVIGSAPNRELVVE